MGFHLNDTNNYYFHLQALIEKDWLGFGHKFQDRCGHIQGDLQETSPTFVQFLDAVWQLTQMFPASFQVGYT